MASYRVHKSDYPEIAELPWEVQVWSVFYNSFQTVQGGFAFYTSAREYIDSGNAAKKARADKSL